MKGIAFILIAALLVSCVANTVDVQACVEVEPDGFWMGLWHGIISPVTFIFSLFMDDVAIYSVNNTGGWYDFGFLVGAGVLFGGSSSSASK